MLRFEFVERENWPPLAWLAHAKQGDDLFIVQHGSRVEVTQRWFCEAVWAGPYGEGGFDQTDIVAGSGGRVRDNLVKFVSAGHAIDRLHSMQSVDSVWVSNSMVCLLAARAADVDPAYGEYYDDSHSIIHGLDKYKRTLETSNGDLTLTYFNNLVWDGQRLSVEPKPEPRRDFSSFAKYRAFMETSLGALVENLNAPQRRHAWGMISGLSSGYDSTTVTVLARQFGLQEIVTFAEARGGGSDDGTSAAKALGLKINLIERNAWRTAGKLPEIPFVASYSSAEDMVFKGAEAVLADKVFFMGYYGDKIWGKSTKGVSEQVSRGDPAGLALTEYRLWAGFINCSVPFWGFRQIKEVIAINHTEEMKPWDVPGDYSRPICRRICEEAGVPREAFGVKKRAITVNPFAGLDFQLSGRDILTSASLEDYLTWLREHRSAWTTKGRVPPIANAKLNYLINWAHMHFVDFNNALGRTPLWRTLDSKLYRPQYLKRYLFPWAMHRAKQRYPMD